MTEDVNGHFQRPEMGDHLRLEEGVKVCLEGSAAEGRVRCHVNLSQQPLYEGVHVNWQRHVPGACTQSVTQTMRGRPLDWLSTHDLCRFSVQSIPYFHQTASAYTIGFLIKLVIQLRFCFYNKGKKRNIAALQKSYFDISSTSADICRQRCGHLHLRHSQGCARAGAGWR